MNTDQKWLPKLEWRSIGPYRGGRVVAVAGDPIDRNTFYFGACAGGIWKTTDGGVYWQNISDGHLDVSSIGAIAVSESDPSEIYAGTGEACIRGDVSHGDGVYKSSDGGKTWKNIGLRDTRHISRIRIHPSDSNHVFVAALGHAFGPNKERGVFRSKDGGCTWEHILFKSEKAGAIDLAMDANNPRIIFASIWEALRTPWSLVSAGEDSGLWRSNDGGDNWEDISNNPGMPKGIKGRIGVAVSPAKFARVWAIVEAEDGALLRSDDGGDTWKCVNDSSIVRQRPFYHHHIFAHPKDPDTMWTLPIQAWRSDDGGSTFNMITTPHNDNHDLWIDPNDPERMIEGNDGGACVSYNGGLTWSSIYNQPTSQFYHVATDNRVPYRVYGTQQDNSAISTPSGSAKGVINFQDSYAVGPSESGYIVVHPENSDIVYSGAIGSAPGGGGTLIRYDHKTGESRIITVWPEMSYGQGAKDMKYRFQWTFPIVLSSHNHKVLYVAGNHLFRSSDEGVNWEIISPDLTRNDKTKGEPGGGPISRDVSGAEVYCTIFSFAESYHTEGMFWVGTDDGLVQLSQDGGVTWRIITPNGLPKFATISAIELSRHDHETAYVAAWNYKLDDYSPYIYKTKNAGKTWDLITKGLPEDDFVRVIREDPARKNLLYAGTEKGIYLSLNGGESWQSFQGNLPISPVHDLMIKDDDLVAATHGRSFWILDDITPLRQIPTDLLADDHHLFKPRSTYRNPEALGKIDQNRIGPGKNYWVATGIPCTFEEYIDVNGVTRRRFLDSGTDITQGVTIHYYLKSPAEEGLQLSFLNANNGEIASFSNDDPCVERRITNNRGMNRFVWNMRYKGPIGTAGDSSEDHFQGPNPDGPKATPGLYCVVLTSGDLQISQEFEILKHPNCGATQEDLQKQLDLLLSIRELLSRSHVAITELRTIRNQISNWLRSIGDEMLLHRKGDNIISKLNDVEKTLITTWSTKERGQFGLPLPQLVESLASLISVVESADALPTTGSYDVFHHLSKKISYNLELLKQTIVTDVGEFSSLLRSRPDYPVF